MQSLTPLRIREWRAKLKETVINSVKYAYKRNQLLFLQGGIYINKSKELLKLVAENPDLPVVPLVDSDVVGDDSGYWIGSFGRSEVGEYALYGERYYTDRDDLEEVYADYIADDYPDMSDDEFFAMVKEKTKDWWTKAILVYVSTPD